MTTAAIIGAGRLGTILGRALLKIGYRIGGLSCLTLAEAEESRRIVGGGAATTENTRAAESAEFIIISVPDRGVAGVARELAAGRPDWNGRLVWHCSGLLPCAVLDPLLERGAMTAAVHPVQTFASKTADPALLRGVHFSVEGGKDAVRKTREIVEDLGGLPFSLEPGNKPLYHAACSTASNLMTALLESAVSLLSRTGPNRAEARDILFPLVQKTLHNVKNLDAGSAMTGPVSRGDIETVAAHLQALEGEPEMLEIYRLLARRSLDLTRSMDRLSEETLTALAALLEDK